MDREQIKKLSKKFNIKQTKKTSIVASHQEFNFGNSKVNEVNLQVFNEITKQLQSKNYNTKLEIFNFDVQLDVFLSLFPNNIKLQLANELLKTFQVKTTIETRKLGANQLLTTIIDNKIKLFEALYIMHVDKNFKNYILPDTILLRLSKILIDICSKIGFVKANSIPSDFGISQHIDFMYIIINKMLVEVGGSLSTPVVTKVEAPVQKVEAPKPIPVSTPAPIQKPETVTIEQVLDYGQKVTPKDTQKQIKFDCEINTQNLTKLISKLIETPEDLRKPVRISKNIVIHWNPDFPELAGFAKDKYYIEFNTVKLEEKFAGLQYGFSEVKQLFPVASSINHLIAEATPGTVLNHSKVIGYKFKDIQITYERFKEDLLKANSNGYTLNNVFSNSDFSIMFECTNCKSQSELKVPSVISKTRSHVHLCSGCNKNIPAYNKIDLVEILLIFRKFKISLDNIVVKNFSNFKFTNANSEALTMAKCSCGKPINEEDFKIFLNSGTHRVNCSKDCSVVPNELFSVIYNVREFSDWQFPNFREAAERISKSTIDKIENSPGLSKPQLKIINPLEDEVEKVNTPAPKAIEQIKEKEMDKVMTEKPVVQVEASMPNIPSMPSIPFGEGNRSIVIEAISDVQLREDFLKKFRVPFFNFKIFAYIPELKLYSGMLNGTASTPPVICNWTVDGIIDKPELQNKFNFIRKNVLVITNNNLNTVLNALVNNDMKIKIPNGEIEMDKLSEIKIKLAELIIAAITKN